MKLLLEAGARVDLKDGDEKTPLDLAPAGRIKVLLHGNSFFLTPGPACLITDSLLADAKEKSKKEDGSDDE